MRHLILATVVVTSVVISQRATLAYTPNDPIVSKMVASGLRFIEEFKTPNEGEVALLGYAHFKAEHDESNPVVQQGIKAAEKFAASVSRSHSHKSHYECAVSTLLMCEINPNRFRKELGIFQRFYQETQMPHGGFGYPEEQLGDVSQTQYAILAMWALDRSGFKVDYARVKKAMDWLLIVQDVNGPWPYHGKVPRGGRLSSQEKTSESMAVAGAASLLIAADSMGMWGEKSDGDETGIVGFPKAVKLYSEDSNADRRKRATKTNPSVLFQRIDHMERWRSNHPTKLSTHLFFYFYQVYTIERYESFMEIAKGQTSNPSPAWYNVIVDQLRERQSENGGWEDRAHTNPGVSTAFAILFLIRSTKKSLGAGASATTRGGKGFGPDVSKAQLVDGSAKSKSPAKSVTGMLDLLESDGADELDGKSLSESAVLPTNPTELSAQLDRLERLVRGSKSWQARRVSAKLLGSSDSFRVVPALIFALSDPDESVRAYARDGLRFISRNFEGYGMPDEPTNSEIRKAQKAWRSWYKKVRPDYVFLDD